MSSRSLADPGPLPEARSLALHLDLVGGIAGDMFVAAMIDALPALEPAILSAVAAVRPEGAAGAFVSEGTSGGLRARRFGTAEAGAPRNFRKAATQQSHASAITGDNARGSSHAALRARIVDAALPAATREHALALLALLAGAEAAVHGIAVADVHFHELGDWDSLMDVVAAGSIAAQLAGARWSSTPPPLGGGSVRTAHGIVPVPAPATAALLTGYPWREDGVGGERVTPTGAAILCHLVDSRDCGAAPSTGTLVGVGCGAGTRELPGIPNIVRALVFERVGDPTGIGMTTSSAGAAPAFADQDAVSTLEFDVDDMTGEEIAIAAEHLRAEPGVLDVSIGTRFGKKGRAVADFRVLARGEVAVRIAQVCFDETTTLGLRLREERRLVLRRSQTVETLEGERVRVKVAARPDGGTSAKAEHDDVAKQRGLGSRRAARSAAVRLALKRRQP